MKTSSPLRRCHPFDGRRIPCRGVVHHRISLEPRLCSFRRRCRFHPRVMALSAFGSIPLAVLSDSYKATHFKQYPQARRLVAYGECRTGLFQDAEDTRIIVYGIRFLVENVLNRQWTLKELEDAEKFYNTHKGPDYTPFQFPKELFKKFIIENDGYFPIKFEALPDGCCVHAHVPIYQITAEVATLSRRVRDVIESAFVATADHGLDHPLIQSRLHDFGFRGCTTVDQAVIGGCAHLLNFTGTDTMAAAYHAQFALNDGEPIGNTVPATEHSVMTSWETETDAIFNMIQNYGDGLFAVVMDSYDYVNALENVLPAIAANKLEKGGFILLRPDSGDPVESVIQALKAADRVFGSTVNSKGFRVLHGCGVVQGDGMDLNSITAVLTAVQESGYSAENCAFGMGSGLLQKVNRDTMSFATKLCNMVYANGHERDIMKTPKTDTGKISLPGRLAVKSINGVPTVFPAETVTEQENMLRVMYNCRPCESIAWESFSTLRERIATEWTQLPKTYDPISTELRYKIDAFRSEQQASNIAHQKTSI